MDFMGGKTGCRVMFSLAEILGDGMGLLGEFDAEVDELFGGLFFVLFEGHGDPVGSLGVGTVDGLAAMS
jgi:hypothetical protein